MKWCHRPNYVTKPQTLGYASMVQSDSQADLWMPFCSEPTRITWRDSAFPAIWRLLTRHTKRQLSVWITSQYIHLFFYKWISGMQYACMVWLSFKLSTVKLFVQIAFFLFSAIFPNHFAYKFQPALLIHLVTSKASNGTSEVGHQDAIYNTLVLALPYTIMVRTATHS